MNEPLIYRRRCTTFAGVPEKERFNALLDIKDRYDYEFEENGTKNVFIIKNPFLKALIRMLPGRLADRPDDDGDETCVCPECAAKIAAGERLQKIKTAESPSDKTG